MCAKITHLQGVFAQCVLEFEKNCDWEDDKGIDFKSIYDLMELMLDRLLPENELIKLFFDKNSSMSRTVKEIKFLIRIRFLFFFKN